MKDFLDGYFVSELRTSKRTFAIAFLAYFALSNVYYLAYPAIMDLASGDVSRSSLVWWFFNLSIGGFMVFSGLLNGRVRRLSTLYVWTAVNLVTLTLLLIIPNFNLAIIIFCFQGALLGLALIAYMTFFSSRIRTVERGRVGGLVVSLSLFLAPPLSLSLAVFRPWLLSAFLSVLALAVFLLKPGNKHSKGVDRSYFDKKNFLLYLSTWVLFSLVNSTFQRGVSKKLRDYFAGQSILMLVSKYLAAGVGASVGGFLSDRVGRKPIIEFGLIMLGIASAAAGFMASPEVLFLLHVTDGLSWGIFLVFFYLILWGEFGPEKSWGVCYALGLSAFHFSQNLGFVASPFIDHLDFRTSAFISSILIFISFIPLLRAKETLQRFHKMPKIVIDEIAVETEFEKIAENAYLKKLLEQMKRRRKPA